MILTRKEGAGEAESEKEKCGWTRGLEWRRRRGRWLREAGRFWKLGERRVWEGPG